jgi:hypothetical protein
MTVIKSCHACHGASVVRVRFVDNKHGKVRVITCPDCKGRGSWVSVPFQRDPNTDWETWLALQDAPVQKGDSSEVRHER